jgi:hyperosmotically inducible periplasmic protein
MEKDMHKILIMATLLIFARAAFAQTPESAPAVQMALSSDGPVVADYNRTSYPNTPEGHIAKEVRHELLMLPYYSLFDDLQYSVQGRTVTLSGELTSEHSLTKSEAQAVVKRIEGVDNVINNIKVLPPSPMDQQARERIYHSLSNTGSLSRYFWEASPSIHIIVDNLRVTLKGYVNSEGDKNLATIAASQVPDVFKVTNELRVVK